MENETVKEIVEKPETAENEAKTGRTKRLAELKRGIRRPVKEAAMDAIDSDDPRSWRKTESQSADPRSWHIEI